MRRGDTALTSAFSAIILFSNARNDVEPSTDNDSVGLIMIIALVAVLVVVIAAYLISNRKRRS